MKIFKYIEFKESISGTELVGQVGPNYGDTSNKNKTLGRQHTTVIKSTQTKNKNSNNVLTDDIYFEDDYHELYNNYIKLGGDISKLNNDKSYNIKVMSDFYKLN
jgi:hypothetical protein